MIFNHLGLDWVAINSKSNNPNNTAVFTFQTID